MVDLRDFACAVGLLLFGVAGSGVAQDRDAQCDRSDDASFRAGCTETFGLPPVANRYESPTLSPAFNRRCGYDQGGTNVPVYAATHVWRVPGGHSTDRYDSWVWQSALGRGLVGSDMWFHRGTAVALAAHPLHGDLFSDAGGRSSGADGRVLSLWSTPAGLASWVLGDPNDMGTSTRRPVLRYAGYELGIDRAWIHDARGASVVIAWAPRVAYAGDIDTAQGYGTFPDGFDFTNGYTVGFGHDRLSTAQAMVPVAPCGYQLVFWPAALHVRSELPVINGTEAEAGPAELSPWDDYYRHRYAERLREFRDHSGPHVPSFQRWHRAAVAEIRRENRVDTREVDLYNAHLLAGADRDPPVTVAAGDKTACGLPINFGRSVPTTTEYLDRLGGNAFPVAATGGSWCYAFATPILRVPFYVLSHTVDAPWTGTITSAVQYLNIGPLARTPRASRGLGWRFCIRPIYLRVRAVTSYGTYPGVRSPVLFGYKRGAREDVVAYSRLSATDYWQPPPGEYDYFAGRCQELFLGGYDRLRTGGGVQYLAHSDPDGLVVGSFLAHGTDSSVLQPYDSTAQNRTTSLTYGRYIRAAQASIPSDARRIGAFHLWPYDSLVDYSPYMVPVSAPAASAEREPLSWAAGVGHYWRDFHPFSAFPLMPFGALYHPVMRELAPADAGEIVALLGTSSLQQMPRSHGSYSNVVVRHADALSSFFDGQNWNTFTDAVDFPMPVWELFPQHRVGITPAVHRLDVATVTPVHEGTDVSGLSGDDETDERFCHYVLCNASPTGEPAASAVFALFPDQYLQPQWVNRACRYGGRSRSAPADRCASE